MFAALILCSCVTTGDEVATAPPPREKYVRPAEYKGEVMALPRGSITIRGKDPRDRTGRDVIRTFKGGTALLKGEQEPSEAMPMDYRLSDLKVGDLVFAVLREDGEEDTCVSVRILRRPGGMVPPAPFEPAGTLKPYHEHMNALQAHEERGVPPPLKYDPDYQRMVDEARHKDLLETRLRLERIAPPPRPVIRK